MLKFPKVLPSWMYRCPNEVIDRLLQDTKKRERDRQHKHKRIERLTKEVLSRAHR
jgi:hypothetical protein